MDGSLKHWSSHQSQLTSPGVCPCSTCWLTLKHISLVWVPLTAALYSSPLDSTLSFPLYSSHHLTSPAVVFLSFCSFSLYFPCPLSIFLHHCTTQVQSHSQGILCYPKRVLWHWLGHTFSNKREMQLTFDIVSFDSWRQMNLYHSSLMFWSREWIYYLTLW